MHALGIGADQVVAALKAENQELSAGSLSVRGGEAERASVALVNGKTALTLDIVKVQGGNTIEVADLVRAKTAQLARELAPEGIVVTTLNDGSTGVRRSLSGVRANLLEGALLTVAIVFLFLGSWRSTVITGLTLPVVLVGTLFFIYIAGFESKGARVELIFMPIN